METSPTAPGSLSTSPERKEGWYQNDMRAQNGTIHTMLSASLVDNAESLTRHEHVSRWFSTGLATQFRIIVPHSLLPPFQRPVSFTIVQRQNTSSTSSNPLTSTSVISMMHDGFPLQSVTMTRSPTVGTFQPSPRIAIPKRFSPSSGRFSPVPRPR